jgi:hypothetical protein
VKISVLLFCVVTCGFAGRRQRFVETNSLHLQARVRFFETFVSMSSHSVATYNNFEKTNMIWTFPRQYTLKVCNWVKTMVGRSLKCYIHSYFMQIKSGHQTTGKEKSWVSRCNKQEIVCSIIMTLFASRKQIKPAHVTCSLQFQSRNRCIVPTNQLASLRKQDSGVHSTWFVLCAAWLTGYIHSF